MSKLFTLRGLFIQAMLYAISRAIWTLIKSEMTTTKIGSNTTISSTYPTGGSDQISTARSQTQSLLDVIKDGN